MKKRISRIIIILFPIMAISTIPLFLVSWGNWYNRLFSPFISLYPLLIIPFACLIFIFLRAAKILTTVELLIYLIYYGLVDFIMLGFLISVS